MGTCSKIFFSPPGGGGGEWDGLLGWCEYDFDVTVRVGYDNIYIMFSVVKWGWCSEIIIIIINWVFKPKPMLGLFYT